MVEIIYVFDTPELTIEERKRHSAVTFRVKCSRVVSHELVRSRKDSSYSQRSQRYVREEYAKYYSPPELLNYEFVSNRSREDYSAMPIFTDLMELIWWRYLQFVNAGIPKQIARYILPNATDTEVVVTMTFDALLHLFDLRCSKKAQPEFRELASELRFLLAERIQDIFS
jgi:thymidylate synthase (FAD)